MISKFDLKLPTIVHKCSVFHSSVNFKGPFNYNSRGFL